jgi:fatty acid synthase
MRILTFDCVVYLANGYARSEAVCVILLQKARDAKRVYATVVHAKSNCDGYKEQGITYPSGQMQTALLEEFYNECTISPTVLGYIEAHGTGTKVWFLQGGKQPLFYF